MTKALQTFANGDLVVFRGTPAGPVMVVATSENDGFSARFPVTPCSWLSPNFEFHLKNIPTIALRRYEG